MGTTCLLTCGPIYGTYLLQQKGTGLRLAGGRILKILLGRFLAYSLFGSIAGLLGAKVTINHRPILIVIANFLCALLLVIVSILNWRDESGCSSPRYAFLTKNPMLLGIITGINLNASKIKRL